MLIPVGYERRAGPIRPVARPESGNPAPGNPGHISLGKPGKLKGLRWVRADPAATRMTWRLTASGPPRLRVVWGTRQPLWFCVMLSSGSAGFSRMLRLLVLHIWEMMPVSRANPASQAPSPARRAAVRRSRGYSR